MPPMLTEEQVRVGMEATFRLFTHWELSVEQQRILLGGPPPELLELWEAGDLVDLPEDGGSRLSHLLAVHVALRMLFRDRQQGNGWIKRPNRHFGGRSALDIMLGGSVEDLATVRRYLDSWAHT